MITKSTLYGVAVAAAALVLISAVTAGYYYVQDANANSSNSRLVAEVNGANANYTDLAASFNLLLARYNQSIYLLTNAIAVMNTSLPAYRQASAQLSALWMTYESLNPAPRSLLHNSVYFDFGNGTRRWYNNTAIDAGWNMYIETVVLMNGEVEGAWYPAYGEHFITAIGGVQASASEYWFLWSYNRTSSWRTTQVGADDILVTAGSIYAWTFCGADSNFNPICRP